MYILGISSYYHDSAACLIKDGDIIAAVQEERFTRKKHDFGFPKNSIKFCLKQAKIKSNKISNVVFYEKPFLKFERLLETYLSFAPKGFKSFAMSLPIWIKDKLFLKRKLLIELKKTLGNNIDWENRLLFSEHHLSHAASAYYPSPFNRAAIMTFDGVGEWTTTSLGIGKENNIKIIKEIHFPHSLGLLYSAFTYYCGFKVNSGEYKLMGLAPYGKPKYINLIKQNLIKVANDGSFKLNMKYFDYATGLTMTNDKFNKLFEGNPRKPEGIITQREMDMAASVQKVTEEVIIKSATFLAKETKEKNLCLAGGVALNCVANGVLVRKKIFKEIWIQPAAGDAGAALGAALAIWYLHYNKKRKISEKSDSMKGSYLGPEYSLKEIKSQLVSCGANFQVLNENTILNRVVNYLIKGKTIGWMQGRMEFGARSLGARSIIADPRLQSMQRQLNLKIKYRESFRPFAPSILSENTNEWFEHNSKSPYMQIVTILKKNRRLKISKKDKQKFGIEKLNIPRSLIPAVTHVDYSARIQTVHKDTNSIYYKLLSKFYKKTGVPILVNTSFNIRGEPIVCNPIDSFKCFMATELDVLVIGRCLLIKKKQNKINNSSYKKNYELD
jgi:carbamoyltransferase